MTHRYPPQTTQTLTPALQRELDRHAGLFDTIERMPLTLEQRIAAVTMASRNVLIAAAGSGKTSSMVGKVAYAIRSGLCKPEQVLVLAFNRKAAIELDQRLQRCLAPFVQAGVGVKTRTLHALGLDIVSQVKGHRPHVLDHDNGVLHTVLKQLVHQDVDFAERWLLFRVFYHVPVCPPEQYASPGQWRAFVRQYGERRNRRYGFATLRDELVPTQFEQAVANWLYLYDIDYVYIPLTRWFATPASVFQRWRPGSGFTRPLAGRTGFLLTSLSLQVVCLDGRKPTISTDSHTISLSIDDFHDGTVFQTLRQRLDLPATAFKPDRMAVLLGRLGHRLTPGQVDFLARFIRIARLAGIDSVRLMDRVPGRKADTIRVTMHAPMLARLLQAYSMKLDETGAIDFEGMLHRAADYLDSGQYQHPYTLILVDEFQDTSQGGLRLIQSLLAQNRDCKLFAVGDDWQSIYRFAGAIPDVLSGFEQQFGLSAVNYLTATFRFNQVIADVARRFVQLNPLQIRKKVLARPATNGESLVLMRYASLEHMYALCETCLAHVAAMRDVATVALSATRHAKTDVASSDQPCKRSVYILGRYQHQQPRALKCWQKDFPRLDIRYQTIHSAKGLEADVVIVLGLQTGRYGFPSQVPDDALIRLVMPDAESFPHAEERRLFYVAITRGRDRVYVLASRDQPSPFFTELLEQLPPDKRDDEYAML